MQRLKVWSGFDPQQTSSVHCGRRGMDMLGVFAEFEANPRREGSLKESPKALGVGRPSVYRLLNGDAIAC